MDTNRLELPIGFGTGQLGGGGDKKRSFELLEAAYDAGIRYFDTARLYAQGHAEGVLGEFLQGKRDEVILTSKAGIEPVRDKWTDRALGKAQKAASLIGLAKPPVREPLFGQFDVASLRESVAMSQKELRTDRFNALLLHEVRRADLADGSVRAFCEELVADGRIGAYGLATTRSETTAIVTSDPEPFGVVQTARSVFDGSGIIANAKGTLSIHHSVLVRALPKLLARAEKDADFARRFARETGVDAGDRGALAGLLLAEAIDANTGGVTLFSSSSPDRIRNAARVARERPFALDQINGLRRVVAAPAAEL